MTRSENYVRIWRFSMFELRLRFRFSSTTVMAFESGIVLSGQSGLTLRWIRSTEFPDLAKKTRIKRFNLTIDSDFFAGPPPTFPSAQSNVLFLRLVLFDFSVVL